MNNYILTMITKKVLEKQMCEVKFLENENIPKLSKMQSDECDDDLALQECRRQRVFNSYMYSPFIKRENHNLDIIDCI